MNNTDYLRKYLDSNKLEEGIKKLEEGIPPQYIVGNVDFYGYIYDVDSNVLIPRFETEELVNKTIKYIEKYFDKIELLDLGTGSGCIAITIANEIDAKVTAVDISSKALDVARHNALKYQKNIIFIESNMFDKVTGRYDVIISNPPYISKDEEIMDIVRNNEPDIALYADNNGLYYYEDILSKAHKYLKQRSMIAFEIGYLQGDDIKKIALKYFPDSRIEIFKDMEGKDRFIFIFNNM